MALQSSGAISMSEIRTEFGMSGSISMSTLYRGGSNVPTEKTLIDAITSVSDSGFGYIGYGGVRYNYGDLSTATAVADSRYHQQSNGYLFNNTSPSASVSSKTPTPSSLSGILSCRIDSSALANESTPSGFGNAPVLTVTFAKAGTYYVWANEFDSQGKLTVSGADSGNLSETTIGNSSALRASIVVVADDVITITMDTFNECILYDLHISTKSGSISRLTDINTDVPTSGAITFSDFYSGEDT